ncbi:MAG: DUF2934 domain-containing protein [Phycisphaerales bacterium]|nr:DUF2934 domain-containing protein [Phycisphaerales bacterium]
MSTKPTTSRDRKKHRLAPAEITHEHIRHRAYQIFEARNGAPGSPTLDWLQAEQELRDAQTSRAAKRSEPSLGGRKAR